MILDHVKAITIYQPWASMLIHGFKLFETRSWAPRLEIGSYLAIHAGAKDPMTMGVLRDDPYLKAAVDEFLEMHGLALSKLPLGSVLGVCEYRGFVQAPQYVGDGEWFNALGTWMSREVAVGDWIMPGRLAWRLEPLMRLDSPIPVKGRQGLWNWTPTEGLVVPQ